MEAKAPQRWAGRLTGAFLAFLAVSLAAPRAGRAECGHYVVARSQAGEELAWLDVLFTTGPHFALAEEAASDRSGHPMPCSGPFCSGAPSRPVGALGSEPRLGESRALFEVFWLVVETDPSLAPPADETLRPIHTSVSVFHPPRPSARRSTI